MKLRVLAILAFAALSAHVQAQTAEVPIIKPTLGEVPDLSEEAQKKFKEDEQVFNRLIEKQNDGEELAENEAEFVSQYNETFEDIWDTMGAGCSWYCGGTPNKVEASSTLNNSASGISYNAANAHDFSLKTAWVEGVKGYGIGESLTYYFDNENPRITRILIYNGYVKSEQVWKSNSRVKKLKVYENDELIALLELADTRALQTFEMPNPLGRRTDGAELILQFEIADVYKGNTYDDTAITELYFDGLDVHCIGKGSQVLMADGSTKNIEDISAGEIILQYTPDGSRKLTTCVVNKLIKVSHTGLLELTLEDGKRIVTTDDHPFYLANKGWCSYNPEKTMKNQQYTSVGAYKVADRLVVVNSGSSEVKGAALTAIKRLPDAREVYTLELEDGDNFIANGFVLGEERLN